MAVGVDDARTVQVETLRPITLSWFVKRSLVGIAILVVMMGGLAWLTYASIDPTLETEMGAAAADTAVEAPQQQMSLGL